ncbi:ERF family protein [Lactobacillus crispatus]|nr:hypothetical protein CEE85_12530 [Lactobacillus crispatus]UAY48238.1 ERF family protein [Lactobacillus crispatus]
MHLAMVKMAIVQPRKTHEVEVRGTTQNGKPYHYTYKYADLADVDKSIMNAIKATKQDDKPLLTYYFDIDNGAEGVTIETVIVDATTGYSVRTNKVWFKNVNVGNAQATASLISYGKRYSLSAAFGIASEDDDDAQAQKMNQSQVVDENAIKIIFEDYVNNHSIKAKNWIKGKHDKATGDYIRQLLGDYELNHHLDKAKQKAVDCRKERDQQVKETVKKIKKPKSEDEVIKDIVDKPKTDPFPDKKEDAPMSEEQQSLFDDILGD